MRILDKRLRLLLLICFVLAAACAAPQRVSVDPADARFTDQAAAPKRFTAAIMGDPSNLFEKFITPGSGQAPGSSTVDELVHVGLAEMDNEGILRARLAEGVPSLENGLWRLLPDGRMETIWRIRAGASWHDGVDLDADDLVFSAKFAGDAELPIDRDVAFNLIERVDAPDPRTVRVLWAKPFIFAATLFSSMRGLPLPRHILEAPYVEDKTRVAALPFWSEEFVGAGPYRIREWVRGSHLMLEANDRYVLGAPKIGSIEVRFIPDPNSVFASVLAGTVELTLGATMALDQTLALSQQWQGGRLDVWFNNWVAAHPQFLNPTPRILADLRFRQALMQAIDRQRIVDTLMSGRVPIAESYVNPKIAEAREIDSYIVRFQYDPRESAGIIEGLGYTKGADGMFRDAAGQALSVELRGSTVTEIGRKAAFPVADDWQRAGVGVDLVMPPPQRSRDREFRATYPSFELARGPNELEGIRRYHSSNNPLAENNYVGTNRTRYANPDLDRLIDAYYVAIPLNERIDLLGQIIHHMTANLVTLPLFPDAESGLVSNRLKNVIGAGGSATQAWNAHEWDLQL